MVGLRRLTENKVGGALSDQQPAPFVHDPFAKGNATRYVGVFFAVAGSNANIPATMAYQANDVRGQWTRAFSSATLVGFGGIGGIVSSVAFRSQDAPEYRPGMWTTIA